MVRVAVAGAAGAMGRRLCSVIHETEGMTLTGALEMAGHPAVGRDVGGLAGLADTGVAVAADLDEVLAETDLLIDFSRHEASMVHLRAAVEHGKAIVIGTTGFTQDEWREIREIGPQTRCLISPNMSVGINVMWRLVREMALALGSDYDVEIVEIHHRRKVDAPSGTALRIAEVLAEALNRDLEKVGVFARHGQVGPRTREEIGIQTLRGGDIVGEHTVIFAGIGERLELTHRAQSRDNFARGAVRAAMWLVDRKPGLYDMQDVLVGK
jgi:4-hydroxy-tetrahydrodipicolinate reductase